MHSANDRIRTSVSTETARAISAYFSDCDLFMFLLHISIHLLLIAKTWAADISKTGAHVLPTSPAATLQGRPPTSESLALAPSPASLKPRLLLKTHEFDNCYHCCS